MSLLPCGRSLRLLALLAGLMAACCGGAGLNEPQSPAYDAAAPASEPAPAPPGQPGLFARGATAEAPSLPSEAPALTDAATAPAASLPSETRSSTGRAPLLIYKATLTLAVFETRRALDEVAELARVRGGYLVSRHDSSITVRVPVAEFQTALERSAKIGDELHREVSVADVTAEFSDLETRLRNAEAVRTRLEALLARAVKIEDAVAVERELERVTGAIEALKGRLKLLSELTAFSTITVNFQARPVDKVGGEVRLPFDWLGELGLPPLLRL